MICQFDKKGSPARGKLRPIALYIKEEGERGMGILTVKIALAFEEVHLIKKERRWHETENKNTLFK